MDRTVHQLIALGLSEKESQVYIALMEMGRGTAYKIAQRAGLKRPTVYLLLDQLRKKDLVGKIPHAKNQLFIAKDPEEFLGKIEQNLERARKVLPDLLARRAQNHITTQIFEGKRELEQALSYKRGEVANSELIAFYGAPREGKKIPSIYRQHAEALCAQDTKVRLLAPDDASLKLFREKDKEYSQEALYLPKDTYFPRVSVEVGGDTTKIFLHGVAQALVIENTEFAKFMKQIFELVWKCKK